ncbi:hypothetical protein [Actinoplanes teichomyceticus]|uniref:Uncharacterized protein n=1 Tax=Actinoplanes teichomyceticus TaxID=1867 RepID=A0A561VQZ9_ACTTI|nr:hypothetical protein [Actinoplanes teichomyceticus]TWG14018.1 hypothetical protein FHX34_104311 [Actinoplanes teichomyceticus]
MPKVVDAARVTAQANTVWRTCTGCSLLKPLADGVERCPACQTPAPQTVTEAGWDLAGRYATLVGRIEAWAHLIPNVSDTERLDHIRQALATLDPQPRNKGVK